MWGWLFIVIGAVYHVLMIELAGIGIALFSLLRANSLAVLYKRYGKGSRPTMFIPMKRENS
jgi:hypothetical protein